MKRTDLAFSLVIALGAMSAGSASAATLAPCDGYGTVTYSPAHPIATDIIAVRVKSWTNPAMDGPATATTLSKIQVLPGDAIYIDVIITPHPERFPGYKTVVAPYDDSFGLMGPFPVGDHPVTTSIYVEDAQGGFAKLCGGPFVSALKVGEERIETVRAPVIEFYNAALDHYFVTQNTNEMATLDQGGFKGWARTGESFLAFVAGKSDNLGRPVCRYYGVPVAGRSTHFYSASATECLELASAANAGQWTLESSDVFEVGLPGRTSGICTIGQTALYRLWNGRADTNHRYTTSFSTREQMIAKGWISEGAGPEGVAMCVPVR